MSVNVREQGSVEAVDETSPLSEAIEALEREVPGSVGAKQRATALNLLLRGLRGGEGGEQQARVLVRHLEADTFAELRDDSGASCRAEAIAALVRLGYPWALHVSPEDLEWFRASTRPRRRWRAALVVAVLLLTALEVGNLFGVFDSPQRFPGATAAALQGIEGPATAPLTKPVTSPVEQVKPVPAPLGFAELLETPSSLVIGGAEVVAYGDVGASASGEGAHASVWLRSALPRAVGEVSVLSYELYDAQLGDRLERGGPVTDDAPPMHVVNTGVAATHGWTWIDQRPAWLGRSVIAVLNLQTTEGRRRIRTEPLVSRDAALVGPAGITSTRNATLSHTPSGWVFEGLWEHAQGVHVPGTDDVWVSEVLLSADGLPPVEVTATTKREGRLTSAVVPGLDSRLEYRAGLRLTTGEKVWFEPRAVRVTPALIGDAVPTTLTVGNTRLSTAITHLTPEGAALTVRVEPTRQGRPAPVRVVRVQLFDDSLQLITEVIGPAVHRDSPSSLRVGVFLPPATPLDVGSRYGLLVELLVGDRPVHLRSALGEVGGKVELPGVTTVREQLERLDQLRVGYQGKCRLRRPTDDDETFGDRRRRCDELNDQADAVGSSLTARSSPEHLRELVDALEARIEAVTR